ncbi:MAG: NAD(P)-dependent oxidoreductase [Planctomycetes bacterium]|nr:NAD(P)-dependent oxidoreductase [Planctomycetota bacterium]
MPKDLPKTIESVAQLMDVMTEPCAGVTKAVKQLGDEYLVLGAGGKMGPALCQMLLRAGAGKVVAVDLFPAPEVRDYLNGIGCETIACDLLEHGCLAKLPDSPNVFIMTGFKFGATGNEGALWAMNVQLPGRIVERYPTSRLLLMSSGNVYEFTAVSGGGAAECDPVGPVGEYAQSRLGGERVSKYMADRLGAHMVIVRLFYSVEMRYGILHDLSTAVRDERQIDLAMGHVNQIWQGDAVAYLIKLLSIADSPAKTVNLTGAEILSVRQLAEMIGKRMGKTPKLNGAEGSTALLGNSGQVFSLFGKPAVSVEQMLDWIVPWVRDGKGSLGKPTKYERRDGKF